MLIQVPIKSLMYKLNIEIYQGDHFKSWDISMLRNGRSLFPASGDAFIKNNST